jgi:hypothetical protein
VFREWNFSRLKICNVGYLGVWFLTLIVVCFSGVSPTVRCLRPVTDVLQKKNIWLMCGCVMQR